ncbi:unnamed protein product [Chironomus riparius]|uniref:Uncharacterized protein n=1 Tax=Chironomus riparius TaxID=315576 RepID=A0A9N9RKI2_9DIPT|nr:unnamed protein product [Chironomus riparius]
MDLQFKATNDSDCDSSNDENEYHMEIDFTSLRFNDEAIENFQMIFLYGDIMNKFNVQSDFEYEYEDDDDEDGNRKVNEFKVEKISYVIHSTPSRLAEKLLDVPIIFMFLTDEQVMIGNPITLEVNECFANSIRCNDFKEESLRKTYDLTDDSKCLGKVSLNFSIIKDVGNSNRFRKFYTASTAERLKLEAI